jgi:argininosuccinate lyase
VKLWGGRFAEATDPRVDRFLESVGFDQRLYAEDIAGSIGHARALNRAGVLTAEESDALVKGLTALQAEIAAGAFPWDSAHEDVHMNIEAALTERIGPVAGKLHTGRSRNDQVALDLRLWVRTAGAAVLQRIRAAQQALVELGERNVAVVMPAYTHTQHAQPVLFAHHCLAYVEMLERDHGRVRDALARADDSPLGAGAAAGTAFPIDREALARDLGFTRAAANSLDAVGDRDFVLELLAALSILMVHLSRLAGELVLWASAEFAFVELSDRIASGSSMMPNKKNPCSAELVRGKAGRVVGHLVATLMMLKGLPLAYNRDLQEDKEALFDAVDTATAALEQIPVLLQGITVRAERMRAAAAQGYTLATDLADYLTRKGLPFREAHHQTGQIVAYALAQGKPLEDLSLEELRRFAPLIEEDVRRHLTLEASLHQRSALGGTAPARVQEQLARARARLWP